MADELYALTDDDRDKLVDMFDKVSKILANQPLRNAHTDDGHQANEVYIALTPPGGIAGIRSFGSGTGSAAGPGSVVTSESCDIYKIIENDADETIIEPVEDTSRLVFNVSGSEVAGGEFIPIMKDKFGNWLAASISGGGITHGGDEIRMVMPTITLGNASGTPPLGSGSFETDDTYYWSGYTVRVDQGPVGAGTVYPDVGIYIMQRTTGVGPETARFLKIDGVYLGDFVGVANLTTEDSSGFGLVYCVVGAPGIPKTKTVTVIESIDSVTGVCNGGTPPTISVTVNYTTINVDVIDDG